MPREVSILAPLSGVLVPIDSVPDPVFASRTVGDGVSVDPTSSSLLAPVAGRVTQLHRARHAVTITDAAGLEVLVHIGLDTVMLKGEGLTALVNQGDVVEAGQPLIRFDLDDLGRKARSLLTEIIITNGERVSRLIPATGLVEAGRDEVLRVVLADGVGGSQSNQQEIVLLSDEILLQNPAGLHARPAAVLAAAAKNYGAEIRLLRGAEAVNAKSVVAVMGLSCQQGELLRVQTCGADAPRALRDLVALIEAGCGESLSAGPATEGANGAVSAAAALATAQAPGPVSPAISPGVAAPVAAQRADGALPGISAAPGLAIGRIFQLRQDDYAVERKGGTVAEEQQLFERALATAESQVEALSQTASDAGDTTQASILAAHLELLRDPELRDGALTQIAAGDSAAYAWRHSFTTAAAAFARLDNALLRERAADMRDIGQRVLRRILGLAERDLVLPEDAILIAEELTPSDLAALEHARLKGLCTVGGGVTSHVSIIARSLGLPALVGMDRDSLLSLADGTPAILDANQALLRPAPDEALLARTRDEIGTIEAQQQRERACAAEPAITADGHRIEVVANIRNVDEARLAVANGGEGVGLLRTEFLFDGRAVAPSEQEQALAYQGVAAALGRERPLVVRTLDAGGDKPIAYIPIPKEDNPFLGMRGIRIGLEQPELLRQQLRAILSAAQSADIHIMFPMVASLDELRRAKDILRAEEAALGLSAKVGVMIEVPSAAMMADILAPEVDFFSIGTNDLTQYTLAMDRGHPKLADKADSLHPAVLRMIAMTVEAAHKHGKWVGVCGGLASEVLAVPVLIGLGVDELSVTISDIAAIKAAVRRQSRHECKLMVSQILALGSAADVRAHLVSLAR